MRKSDPRTGFSVKFGLRLLIWMSTGLACTGGWTRGSIWLGGAVRAVHARLHGQVEQAGQQRGQARLRTVGCATWRLPIGRT